MTGQCYKRVTTRIPKRCLHSLTMTKQYLERENSSDQAQILEAYCARLAPASQAQVASRKTVAHATGWIVQVSQSPQIQ